MCGASEGGVRRLLCARCRQLSGWSLTSLMGLRRRNVGHTRRCPSIPGCQAQVMEQLSQLVLSTSFRSGGSQVGWKLALESRSLLTLWPGLDLTGSAPLSLTPAGTRASPEHRCTHHLLPCAHTGVSVGAPLHSYCLGVQGPTPASILCMGAPPPLHPRVRHMEQSLLSSPVALC